MDIMHSSSTHCLDFQEYIGIAIKSGSRDIAEWLGEYIVNGLWESA